jgi:hypothetical protein
LHQLQPTLPLKPDSMARSTAFALTGMLVLAAAACVASMRAPQLEQMVVEGASPKHGDLNTYVKPRKLILPLIHPSTAPLPIHVVARHSTATKPPN